MFGKLGVANFSVACLYYALLLVMSSPCTHHITSCLLLRVLLQSWLSRANGEELGAVHVG